MLYKNRLPLLVAFIFIWLFAQANTGKIKVYFNHPVDTSLSTGQNAQYLHQTVDDTIIAYINRAKYSIDFAIYNYVQSTGIVDIAGAVNNAYQRGVKIRWIYDGSSSNTGVAGLNPGIKTLGSPTTGNYGIMHNKFMVIDAHSADDNDPIVWTGSCNWDREQIDSDVNNIIILQDKNLAAAYTAEFNQMWGDTGLVPNADSSKFGPRKLDITQHTFSIDGKTVECYFSPSDETNDHILSAMRSANSQLYFGVYAFTLQQDADSLVALINRGVYVAGIMDAFSDNYSAYTTLLPIMGNRFKLYTLSHSIYHNKMMIVDPCNTASNPLVETGSHNWSNVADAKNDENTLIIHDSTIANIYYQSFSQNFKDLSGTLADCHTTTEINGVETELVATVYPNPLSTGAWHLQLDELQPNTRAEIYSLNGQLISTHSITNTTNEIEAPNQAGIYLLKLYSGNKMQVLKLVKM